MFKIELNTSWFHQSAQINYVLLIFFLCGPNLQLESCDCLWPLTEVEVIALWQKKCNASLWVERLTHRMLKASHVCSYQTLGFSQRKCNLLLKPESNCLSSAVNDVGEQVSEGSRKDQPHRLPLVPLTSDWLPGKQHYHF